MKTMTDRPANAEKAPRESPAPSDSAPALLPAGLLLAFTIGALVGVGLAVGVSVGAGVTAENVIQTVEVVLAELDRLGEELVGTPELEKARQHAIGSFRLGLETASAHCHRAGESLLAEGKIRTVQEVIDGFRTVTPDDVQRVARRFVRPDNVAMSVVGPYDDAAALARLVGA